MKEKKSGQLRLRLAEEIKRARREIGFSQEGLALAAGVDRTYVSQVERGVANPTVEILERLALALDLELTIELIAKHQN